MKTEKGIFHGVTWHQQVFITMQIADYIMWMRRNGLMDEKGKIKKFKLVKQ